MKNETLLCLVRHGATAWNEAGRLQGRRDIPLTTVGVEQARRAGQALKGMASVYGYSRWSGLYTSPLRRAYATAMEVSRHLNLEPCIVDDLVERAFGPLEGLTREEAEKAFPGWRLRPEPPQGVEDEAVLRRRSMATLGRLASAHPGEAIVVITHGAFINAFLREIIDVDHAGGWSLHNGGFTMVTRGEKGWKVIALNLCDHLPGRKPALAGEGLGPSGVHGGET